MESAIAGTHPPKLPTLEEIKPNLELWRAYSRELRGMLSQLMSGTVDATTTYSQENRVERLLRARSLDEWLPILESRQVRTVDGYNTIQVQVECTLGDATHSGRGYYRLRGTGWVLCGSCLERRKGIEVQAMLSRGYWIKEGESLYIE